MTVTSQAPVTVQVDRSQEDLALIRATQATHTEQLRQHERVIDALEDHMGKMVDKIGGIEKRLLLGIVLVCGSSAGLQDLITKLLG